MKINRSALRAKYFEDLVKYIVQANNEDGFIISHQSDVSGADFTFRIGDEFTDFVLKYIFPQTGTRLNLLARTIKEQLKPKNRITPVVLVIAGRLTDNNRQILEDCGIEVRDQEWILSSASKIGVYDRARQVLGLGSLNQSEGEATLSRSLLDRINSMECGRKHWSAYQKLCAETLEFLFTPPLSSPILEHSTSTGINRRDIILPNYTESGFFAYIRGRYRAEYIVVDAKNYCSLITKSEVLQMANYLSIAGVGLFGSIITRTGADAGAIETIREQWKLYEKMIIALNDEDLKQMILERESDGDPVTVLRQKIEDFRLGV